MAVQLSELVYEFIVTTPAGTAIASPQKTPLKVPPSTVNKISVLVPPGPRGNVGFYLAVANDQVIPAVSGSWIVTDDERISFELTGLPESGDWRLVTYNLGQYPHTLYVRLEISDPPQRTAVLARLGPIQSLKGMVGLGGKP